MQVDSHSQRNTGNSEACEVAVAEMKSLESAQDDTQAELLDALASLKVLHPTPCTLHPEPYTLHPAPYTLHPTPTQDSSPTHMFSCVDSLEGCPFQAAGPPDEVS